MRNPWRAFGALAALLLIPGTAMAEEPAADAEPDVWRYRTDIVTALPTFGYEPATILNRGQEEMYTAAAEPERFLRFGGIIQAEGAYVAIDLRPYTDTRLKTDGIRVNTGGLEVRLSSPISYWIGFGFYHHSSHNFSEGKYGFGTNLNSLFGRIRLGEWAVTLGEKLALVPHLEAHVFVSRDASPYLLTAGAAVPAGGSGETTWRAASTLRVRGEHVRSEFAAVANGDGLGRMASMYLDVPVMLRPGRTLGTFGEHVYIGPYGTFGWNLYHTDVFGEIAWSAGIRADIVVADTML
jgi:hypothetical protein